MWFAFRYPGTLLVVTVAMTLVTCSMLYLGLESAPVAGALLFAWCCLTAGTMWMSTLLYVCGVPLAYVNTVLYAFYVLCGIAAYKMAHLK